MQDQPRILLIEAEPSLKHTLALILRQAGYVVTTACYTPDALRSADPPSYNLVFLDVDRGNPGSSELLDMIHRLSPDVPLLILAASPAVGMVNAAGPNEHRACLVKPIDPAKMLARIRDLLDRSIPPAS